MEIERKDAKEMQVYVPRRWACASADHPDFDRPAAYLFGHSDNYYRFADCDSALRKETRRSRDEAIFPHTVLLRSGFADKGFESMFTISTEDIGPACPSVCTCIACSAYSVLTRAAPGVRVREASV